MTWLDNVLFLLHTKVGGWDHELHLTDAKYDITE